MVSGDATFCRSFPRWEPPSRPPLRINSPRTNFFATYRGGSADFEEGYARKCDEDPNTSLTFVGDPIRMHPLGTYSGVQAGLFSAISSAFIVDG